MNTYALQYIPRTVPPSTLSDVFFSNVGTSWNGVGDAVKFNHAGEAEWYRVAYTVPDYFTVVGLLPWAIAEAEAKAHIRMKHAHARAQAEGRARR